MSFLEVLQRDIGNDPGRTLVRAFRSIATNFGLLDRTVHTVTADAYTLVASDRFVEFTSANGCQVAVNAGVFPVGARVDLLQSGDGLVQPQAGAGVLFDYSNRFFPGTERRHSTITMTQVALDRWVWSGDLQAD